jgi:hypothetical protein
MIKDIRCEACCKKLDNKKRPVWYCLAHKEFYCLECGYQSDYFKSSCHMETLNKDEDFIKMFNKFCSENKIPYELKIYFNRLMREISYGEDL